MKRFTKYFVNGIITTAPIALVLYVVIQIFQFLDNLLGQFIKKNLLKDEYVPGVGLLITILIITVLGWLATQYLSKTLIDWVDGILSRIPFVKSLYKIVKETVQSFFGEKRAFSKVALIRMPGTSMRVMGFVTSDELAGLSSRLEGHIAVYVPQSFQMAGMTVIVPVEDVEMLDVPAEEAMRFILSAGVSGHEANQGTA